MNGEKRQISHAEEFQIIYIDSVDTSKRLCIIPYYLNMGFAILYF
jgi:hypothetical protein